MKLKTKTKTRRFELKLCLPFPTYICEQYAKEVIESIEQDELLVFDPKDETALKEVTNKKGEILILDKAKMPVSIKEWLPVGCQYIRYANSSVDELKEGRLAFYKTNAHQVLWPVYAEHKPEGPAALMGEIIISGPDTDFDDMTLYRDKFKCLIAHELVHVFEYMRFIVPAFMDWRNFWHIVVNDGSSADLLVSNLDMTNSPIDRYGTQLELACLQDYWPSQAQNWFDAFNRDKSPEKKPSKK